MSSRLAGLFRPKEVPVVEQEVLSEKTAVDEEANVISHARDDNTSPSVDKSTETKCETDEILPDVQAGIQDVEALAKVWTRSSLIVAYIT